MTVKEIVIKHLLDNGFDGLCNENCGCGIDDFNPCGESFGDCVPAYKIINPDCDKCSNPCNVVDDSTECYKPNKEG